MSPGRPGPAERPAARRRTAIPEPPRRGKITPGSTGPRERLA
ncbi:hypothetical protein HMPREF0043_01607 [Actinobaculum sp. oral taxon 183 str. F0552]|nr:hypothetical protein HMPREF0043_01607 [Actinobaculum sp. oral taxon 183 str. F0552]